MTGEVPQQVERLDQRLERGAVEIDEVVEIARMLAVHLDAEHSSGRVDGAIVPARVEVWVGASPRLLPATEEHRASRAYVAPEAWGGEPTPASDQFSMAALLYEALCGGRPFPGDDPDEIHASMTTGKPVPLAARVPGLAEAVDAVFGRALSVIAVERYPGCSAFAEDLVKAIERSRDASEAVLVQKPSQRLPNEPTSRDESGSLPPRDEAPIPWLKVAVGLVLLSLVAASLALVGK